MIICNSISSIHLSKISSQVLWFLTESNDSDRFEKRTNINFFIQNIFLFDFSLFIFILFLFLFFFLMSGSFASTNHSVYSFPTDIHRGGYYLLAVLFY